MLRRILKFSKFLKNVNSFGTYKCGLIKNKLVKFDNRFRQEFVRVTILGGDTQAGEALAFILKQNPLVSQIYLYGESDVVGIAADLKHLDTRSKVSAYIGEKGLIEALRRADIVILLGHDICPVETNLNTVLSQEGGRVFELAVACTKYAPKAVIVVSAYPVSATTALVALAFKESSWYHPGRIIGSSSLQQARINTLAASYQDLDPVSVSVPLLGGPELDCLVPLFLKATPVPLLPSDTELLFEQMRSAVTLNPILPYKKCKLTGWPMSEAYSLNQLVTTIGLGLCGDSNAICSAFVRQNFIDNCLHLVTTVKFGQGGIVHNYGIPRLRKNELHRFEQATFVIKEREDMAVDIRNRLTTQTKSQISSLINLGSMSKTKRAAN